MDKEQFIQKLFDAALKAGISECEAYCSRNDELTVQVLDAQIKQYTAATNAGLCFRGVYNGKMGYASTEETDDEAIDMLVESVKQNASLLQTGDDETIYEGDSDYPSINAYYQETADMTAKENIDRAMELERLVKAKDGRIVRVHGCYSETQTSETRIVNSKGMDVSFRATVAGAVCAPIAKDNDNVNYAFKTQYSFRKDAIDLEDIAERAAKEALSGLNAKSIPSGKYKTVLRYDMAATLLATFADVFSAESARKGLSLLKGREGETIASEAVTIIDDPLLENGFASKPFDAEGVKTFTKTVVKNGRLETLLHNRATARELGKVTTGNAAKAGYSAPVRVAPTNLFIKQSDTAFEDLIKSVGNGLLITQLSGMHSGANRISGDFSLGAKGFRIVNGEIADPVEQITIAGNFFDVLKSVKRVASDIDFGRPGSSAIGSPSVYVGEMSVAGK